MEEVQPWTVPLLDDEGVQNVLWHLDALSDHVEHQDPWCSNLGSPLSGHSSNICGYLNDAIRMNPLLMDSFGSVYAKMLGALSARFREPVALWNYASYPGFTIINFDGVPSFKGSPRHFDVLEPSLQAIKPDAKIDPTEHWSYTLPLKLPRQGAGLQVWDMGWAEAMEMCPGGYDIDFIENVADRNGVKMADHSHVAGTACLFASHYLHRVSPILQCEPGDERITLQAFVSRIDGRLRMYW